MQKSYAQYGIIMRTNDTVREVSESTKKNIKNGISKDLNEIDFYEIQSTKDSKTKVKENSNDEDSVSYGYTAWTKMRLQLLAHGTHIAREGCDFTVASGYLCAMIRLMADIEKKQQQQLTAWAESTRNVHCREEEREREGGREMGDSMSYRITDTLHKSSSNLDLLSDIQEDSGRSGKEHSRSIGLLLLSPEGRRLISTELMNHRLMLYQNDRMNTGAPILSASNISRIVGTRDHENVESKGPGFDDSNRKFGRPTSTSSISGGPGNFSGVSGSETGTGGTGLRGSGSASASLSGIDAEGFRINQKIPVRRGKSDGSRSGSISGTGSGRSSFVPQSAHVTYRNSTSTQKGEKKTERYQSSLIDLMDGNRRKSVGSSATSTVGRSRGLNTSVTGSVSSSSCYTVFSLPSILGISNATEKRRKKIQQNKKTKPHSAAGRLINAQLQNYHTISNTASDAASFLSVMLIPENQSSTSLSASSSFSTQSHMNKNSISMNPAGMLKAGLNLSQISANRLKLPSSSRISSMVLNSSTPGKPPPTPPSIPTTPIPTPTPPPVPQGNKYTPSISETRTDSIQTSLSQKSLKDDFTLVMDGDDFPNPGVGVGLPPVTPLTRTLDSLSRMLFEGGVSSDKQDQGVELLEQLSREVRLLHSIV